MTKNIFDSYKLPDFYENCICGHKFKIKKYAEDGNYLELLCINCGRQKQVTDLLNYKK